MNRDSTQKGREVSLCNLQYFREEVLIPSGSLAFAFKAIEGLMMLQETNSNATKPRKIVSQNPLFHRTGIFAEQDV